MIDTQAVKQGLDPVSVIEGYGVELKRRGNRHVGLCPFHPEKTPSFTVFDDGFKCFGCGEAGDIIDFVMLMASCDFKEALSQLGVDDGPVTPEVKDRIDKRKRARLMGECFEDFLTSATNELGLMVQACHTVFDRIQTGDDLDRVGHLYHSAGEYQYHFDLLTGDDDQAKRQLWIAGIYDL